MNVRPAAIAVAHGLLDLVFAPVCLGCAGPISTEATDRLVCRVCWSRMQAIPIPRCDRCWAPKPPSPESVAPRESCPTCLLLLPAIRCVRSVYVMDGPARSLAHELKYGGWRALARPMGERMAELPLPPETSEEVSLVVGVPLSRVRLRDRGYNQAQLLARAFAERRGWVDASEVLERARATETQTALHPAERRANVAGAFRVTAGSDTDIRRHHVMLIDDVWTTGATAAACAVALLAAGARAVSVVTFARALPELGR